MERLLESNLIRLYYRQLSKYVLEYIMNLISGYMSIFEIGNGGHKVI